MTTHHDSAGQYNTFGKSPMEHSILSQYFSVFFKKTTDFDRFSPLLGAACWRMSEDNHRNGAQQSHPSPPSSFRSRPPQRTVLIAAALLFLLGYPVLLIAVYHRFFQSDGAAINRDVCVVTTNEAGTSNTKPRGGRRPLPNVQDALASGTSMLAQVIRQANNPFNLHSTATTTITRSFRTSANTCNDESLDAARQELRLSDRSTQQHPLPQQLATESTSATATEEHINLELMEKCRHDFALGFTTAPDLDDETISLLHQFKDRVLSHIPNFHERAAKVNWGGTSVQWWIPALPTSGEAVDAFEGGRLLYYYFKVMHRYMKDLSNPLAHKIYFPFRLCRQHGCAAEDAIAHSLQFRETYQPWRVTPGMREENSNGFCYVRGFSPPRAHHYGRHTVVWLRLGRHKVHDHYTYFRVVAHTLDRAIAEALHESNYRVGKFNVLIDGTDFDFHHAPSLSQCTCSFFVGCVAVRSVCFFLILAFLSISTLGVKHFVTLSQDHHENRVGVLGKHDF